MPDAKAVSTHRPMSSAHKAALARGREEGRAVRRYLEAIEHNRPKRGRKRTLDSIGKRLGVVNELLASSDPLARLHLLQEKADLTAELARTSSSNDLAVLEKAFVKVAKSYGMRKGIEYHAWRAAGVSAAVLQRAEIGRAPNGRGPATATEATTTTKTRTRTKVR